MALRKKMKVVNQKKDDKNKPIILSRSFFNYVKLVAILFFSWQFCRSWVTLQKTFEQSE